MLSLTEPKVRSDRRAIAAMSLVAGHQNTPVVSPRKPGALQHVSLGRPADVAAPPCSFLPFPPLLQNSQPKGRSSNPALAWPLDLTSGFCPPIQRVG
jgi:hypothetical protein